MAWEPEPGDGSREGPELSVGPYHRPRPN